MDSIGKEKLVEQIAGQKIGDNEGYVKGKKIQDI